MGLTGYMNQYMKVFARLPNVLLFAGVALSLPFFSEVCQNLTHVWTLACGYHLALQCLLMYL